MCASVRRVCFYEMCVFLLDECVSVRGFWYDKSVCASLLALSAGGVGCVLVWACVLHP